MAIEKEEMNPECAAIAKDFREFMENKFKSSKTNDVFDIVIDQLFRQLMVATAGSVERITPSTTCEAAQHWCMYAIFSIAQLGQSDKLPLSQFDLEKMVSEFLLKIVTELLAHETD